MSIDRCLIECHFKKTNKFKILHHSTCYELMPAE